MGKRSKHYKSRMDNLMGGSDTSKSQEKPQKRAKHAHNDENQPPNSLLNCVSERVKKAIKPIKKLLSPQKRVSPTPGFTSSRSSKMLILDLLSVGTSAYEESQIIEETLSFGAVGQFADNTRPGLGPVGIAKWTLPEGHVHIARLSALDSKSVLVEGHADKLEVARRHGEGDDQARSVSVRMRRYPVVVEDPPTHDLKISRAHFHTAHFAYQRLARPPIFDRWYTNTADMASDQYRDKKKKPPGRDGAQSVPVESGRPSLPSGASSAPCLPSRASYRKPPQNSRLSLRCLQPPNPRLERALPVSATPVSFPTPGVAL
ncbi:hypothetical protein NMY22_g19237 [Coprinellus aureogranulatus]|nr:hypothetical protein NMY22_g19237 [Coprinellus aureogranulatus]